MVDLVRKPNKWQKKALTSNISTTTANIINFSNLEVGKTYRITAFASFSRIAPTPSPGYCLVSIIHNSFTMFFLGLDDDGTVDPSEDKDLGFSGSHIFVATNTSIQMDATTTNSNIVLGSVAGVLTWMILEELVDYTQTNEW